jgi:molybdopterin-guanine dinucleotide biosynthesis protein A
MSVTGIILAGGLGRRLGGVDKGLLDFLGKPMVTHVIERLQPQVDEILLNANRELERYARFGLPVILDEITGFAGPLAGLHKGMGVAKHDFVVAVPCDSPLLATDLVTRLMTALINNNAEIAIAKTGTRIHPVFCLCRKSLLPHLTSYLQNGGRKVEAWTSTLKVAEVSFDDNPQAFTNVNTPEELRSLENLT